MARVSSTHRTIARVGDMPADIPALDALDARKAIEHGFHAPEASGGQRRGFHRHTSSPFAYRDRNQSGMCKEHYPLRRVCIGTTG